MKEQKKVWSKPVLVIIERGQPEEKVLVACKTNKGHAPGPDTVKNCTAVKDASCHTNAAS